MRLVAALLLSITLSACDRSAPTETWLPIAGRAVAGDGRLFLTTLTVENKGEATADTAISYFPSASPDGAPRTVSLRVQPRSTVRYELPASLVPPAAPTGSLRLASNHPIAVTGRIHNAGSAGAVYAGIPREMAIASGESTRLRGAAPFRLYVAETRGHPLYFAVRMFDQTGQLITSRRLYVSALEQRSWNFAEPFASMDIQGFNGSGAIVAAGSATSPARDLLAFEMTKPQRPRHRLATGELASYGLATAVLLLGTLLRRRSWLRE